MKQCNIDNMHQIIIPSVIITSRAIGSFFQIVVYTYGLDHAGALATEPTTKREPTLERLAQLRASLQYFQKGI